MVGYAMSASSERSFEDILITFFDSDDFVFVDDSQDKIICRYSRESRNTEVIFSSVTGEDIQFKSMVYDIVTLLKKEELKWGFPVAVSWSKPEFGDLETVNVDFQEMWPAVMFLSKKSSEACVNVTDMIFEGEVRPLHVSFAAEILNMIVHFSGIEISNPFHICYNTLFCDLSFARMVNRYVSDDGLNEKCYSREIKPVKTCRIRLNKRSVMKNLHSAVSSIEIPDESNLKRKIIAIRQRCFVDCVNILRDRCNSRSAGRKDFLEELKNTVSGAVDEIISLTGELLRIYILETRSDIKYLTFNDILSALAFAGDKLDLKSVVRLSRKKSAVVNKCEIPYAVLPNGRLIYS